MKRRRFFKTALTGGLFAGATPSRAAHQDESSSGARRRPRLMFYHDARHPAIYMYEPPMEKPEFEAAVDELLGTPVEALMFGLGDGRTVLHSTRVGELWGAPVKKWPHLIFRRAHQNARMMLERNQDPLRIVCERARAKGMFIYPTLLVNQGLRGSDPEGDVRASNFRWKNRHLEIGAAGDLENFPGQTHLDFKHEQVREERFALIQEVLENYPVDGFELQLNYAGPCYFHPDQVDSGRPLLTKWIERVHEAVKASGPHRELAIKIPSNLDRAYSRGLDVRAWIQSGIVDVLIAESYNILDSQADFRPLVAMARGTSCRVHAALNGQVHSDRLKNATISLMRAAASNYWAQGVDGLYLDQWFVRWPYDASFYEQLREVSHPEVMAPKDKFYYVTTGANVRLGPSDPHPPLPRHLNSGRSVEAELEIADDLTAWDGMGRVHELLLRLRITGTTELDRLSFKLNGASLPQESLRKINQMYGMRGPRARISGYWFIFRLRPPLWPVQGKNRIEVALLERDPEVTPPIELRDIELEIKYLRGKNAGRGRDPEALGRNETTVRLGIGSMMDRG